MSNMDGTVNYEFLLDCEADKSVHTIILEGSTRSTKTYSISQFLTINKCINEPGITVRCFRYDSTTHNTTTIADFKEIMALLGIWEEGSWNGTEKVFRFNNGSMFAFSATSDIQKLQGMKQDIAWYNEAMEITEDAHAQINYRTSQLTIMDFNPSYNHHWLFNLIGEPGVAYKHSTYKDNPFLTDKQVQAIEQYEPTPENIRRGTADAWKWDVYGLGRRGKVEGAIFKLFEITDFFPKKEQCQRWGMGLDFGFSLDPTALIECALFQDELYLREWIYETGLLTTVNLTRPSEPSIENSMNDIGIDKNVKMYADCAAPQAIQDLVLSGFNVIPCVKGPGSILQGIELLKQRKMFIHRKSSNLQLELEHYKWKDDKAHGGFKREPEDKDNHAIDAIRYWAMAELQMQKFAVTRGNGLKSIKAKSIMSRRKRH